MAKKRQVIKTKSGRCKSKKTGNLVKCPKSMLKK